MDKQVENRQIVCMSPYTGRGDGESQADEIDLLEIWDIIWRAKYFIVGFTLAATLAAVWVTLYVLPVTYKSVAVLVPNESASGGLSGMAALASSLPIPLSLPGGDKVNTLIVFLQSRNLKQKLIEKYNLLPRLYKDKWDPARKAWRAGEPRDEPTVVRALQDGILDDFQSSQDKKTQLITISWMDKDPAFAAEMLKRVINEVQYYLANDYVSDAKRERQFVEAQLANVNQELVYWEHQVPSQTLTLAKIQRELLASTTVYTELRKQEELAKIAEAKELVNFKVLDPPFVPERKFKPERASICSLTLVLSGLFSIFIVFVRQGLISHLQKNGNVSK